MYSIIHARLIRGIPWYIGLALVSGLVAGIYRYSVPTPYMSAVQIITSPPPPGETGTALALQPFVNSNSVVHMAQSTEIHDRLIDDFGLINHYGITPSSDLARVQALRSLSANITVQQLDPVSLVIRVHDHDRQVAVDLANAIPALINEMAIRSEERLLDRRSALLKKVNERIRDLSRERVGALADLLVQRLQATSGTHAELRERELRQMLHELIQMDSGDSELQRAMLMTDERLHQPPLPHVTLVKAALPDLDRSHIKDLWLAAFISFAIALLLAPSLFAVGLVAWSEWNTPDHAGN